MLDLVASLVPDIAAIATGLAIVHGSMPGETAAPAAPAARRTAPIVTGRDNLSHRPGSAITVGLTASAPPTPPAASGVPSPPRPVWRTRLAALWTRRQPAAPAPRALRQPSAPIGLAAQWHKVAAVVDRAALSARTMREAQASAIAQLEMAEYALDRLLEEIATVMPTERVGMARRAPALVAVPVARRTNPPLLMAA